jgi:hypothetical protein
MFVIHVMMARGGRIMSWEKVSEEYSEIKTQGCDWRYRLICHIYIASSKITYDFFFKNSQSNIGVKVIAITVEETGF